MLTREAGCVQCGSGVNSGARFSVQRWTSVRRFLAISYAPVPFLTAVTNLLGNNNVMIAVLALSRIACVLGLVLCPSTEASRAAAQNPTPVDAIQGIVSAFHEHPIVIIGENHWLRQAGDFYIRLVRDPAFQNTVQDIVIEFASRNNQLLLDRYIVGEDVPLSEACHIWRDTTKVASWESPIYAEWLAAIRTVNKGLSPSRRLRVLAGDTAIDWSRIRTHSDWAALGNNDVSISDVIVHEVLQKKHRALVVLGAGHVMKSADRTGYENTTTRIEHRYGGSTFVILMLYAGILDRAAEDGLGLPHRETPALYQVAGTPLGEVIGRNGVRLKQSADALLYLVSRESFTQALPPSGSLDAEYMKEVDRRSMIEWGELRACKFLGAAVR